MAKMSAKNIKKKEQIVEACLKLGWEYDRWGNLKKIVGEKEYRIKFEQRVMRYEVKSVIPAGPYSDKHTMWTRLYSGFYAKLSVTPEGKISGLTR